MSNDASNHEIGNEMKVKVTGNIPEQIKQGIEPWESAEVEVNLADLTPEQREVLAIGPSLKLIEATTEAVQSELQSLVDKRTADAQESERQVKEANEALLENIKTATLRESKYSEEGIAYTRFEHPYIDCNPYRCSPEIIKLRDETTDRLRAEAAEKTAASRALVADQIEAAKAERERKEQEIRDQEAKVRREKYARRLETGIVEIPLSRGDRKDWGEPWIAKLASKNGKRPDYDFSEGSYDTASEVLSIPCKPGDVIAYGQKNYRKPKKTIHETRKMEDDGRLVSA